MRQTTKPRTAARGEARERLTAARIHEVALALADANGLDGLSMRRLAAALRVDPMSIYHHVPDKQALLQGVFQRVLEELPVPRAGGAPWQQVLRRLAKRFYAVARRHPFVMPALLASPWATPREREIQAAIDRVLAQAGFEAQDRLRIGRAIHVFASGLAGVAAHGPGGRPLYSPGAVASGRSRGAGAATDPDHGFGIDLMIAGIEALATGAR